MKNQIYIFLNDGQAMEGEPIQAANEALRLLLGAWSKDPCWNENMEVEVWLASGQMYAHYSDLKQVMLENDITCTRETIPDRLMGQTLSHLLRMPFPDGVCYYQPQLIIISNATCQWEELFLADTLNQSPFADVLLLETGSDKSAVSPFPYRSWRVDELNHHHACNFISQNKVKRTVVNVPEWSHVLAKRIEQAAEQGDRDAQFKLANLYRRGLGLRRNMSAAKEWYIRAAEKNHVGALFQLGELYWLGLIGKIDKMEASRWYLQAAIQGNTEAQYRLGILYKYGHGLPIDDSEALKWWQQAATQGHVEAQREVDKIYKRVNRAVSGSTLSSIETDLCSCVQN
ncbi:TPA: sel1 repeat family protein [Aeromonas salmonicida]|nr:sel1 repeat family protein [Aeromonas salmonicida]